MDRMLRFGEGKILKQLKGMANQVSSIEEDFVAMSDNELRGQTTDFKNRFANGETLRFALPDEGTLRFLPGRLEVIAGPDAGREIRFVAPPGAGDAVEITFGRTEGPAYRHVQLLARTVSRRLTAARSGGAG